MNMVFSCFLKRLDFIHRPSLRLAFQCSYCQTETEEGNKKTRAIVLDGTAVGILGELPKFNREYVSLRKGNIVTGLFFL